MIYLIPTLILFGGCKENEILNDFWILYTDKTPFKWIKVSPIGESPKPRVYHTANLFKYYHNEEMIVIFGGRDKSNNSLSDIVGIKKNLNNEWEWCYFYDKFFADSNVDFGNGGKNTVINNYSNAIQSHANYGSFSSLDNYSNFGNMKPNSNSIDNNSIKIGETEASKKSIYFFNNNLEL